MTRVEIVKTMAACPKFFAYWRKLHGEPMMLQWMLDTRVAEIYNTEFLPWKRYQGKKARRPPRSGRKMRRQRREQAGTAVLTALHEAEALILVHDEGTADQLLNGIGMRLSDLH